MSCWKITSVCLSFAAKCWRGFTNTLMTLRHCAFSSQHRTQFSEDFYAFVLWRYVAVQIWRVKELFVPGIVASTIKIVSKEVLWSVRGSYQTIWGPPLPNVTRHFGWWPHTVTPSIDRTLHHFLTITDLDLITEFDFLPNVQGFHRTYATGAACQQRTLTPPDTWSCPILGLACVLMSRLISPELVLSSDFWISNIPRYFSFAWLCYFRCIFLF